MSQQCVNETCKRTPRAICYCCNTSLCLDHLKEHNDSIKAQLNPLCDEINELGDHLIKITLPKLVNENHQKLDKWREESYKMINQLYKQKYHEIHQYCLTKIDKSRKEIDQIRFKLSQLIREEEATNEVIQSLLITIKDIKQKINEIEQNGFQFNIQSLAIDNNLTLKEESTSNKFNLSILSSSCHTIHSSNQNTWALASNEQFLLIDQYPILYLFDQDLAIVKQYSWKYDPIRDMCWAATLKKFIIITVKKRIYLVNENLTLVEHIRAIKEENWWSLTSSDTSLFLTTNESNTNIYEFDFLPSIQLVKQWKPPYSCKQNEFIYHIKYNDGTLASIITHSSDRTVHLVVRSSTTFDLLWLIQLDLNYKWFKTAVRCCSLKNAEWIVIEEYTSSIFHIGKDGKLIAKRGYDIQPWNVIMFNSNLLTIRTETSVNIHRL